MTMPIKEYLSALIPDDQQWKITLFKNWDTIMGPLKDKVTIAQITEDVLFLKVVHPAWAQELFLLSSILTQKINTCLNASYIKSIRFVTSDVKIAKPKRTSRYLVDSNRKSYTKINLLNCREAAVLAHVQDVELKGLLELFFLRCKILKGE